MPAIRDYKTAFEASATDAGLTIETPDNVAGDVLFAYVQADTFSNGLWQAPTGWTLIGPVSYSFHTTNSVDGTNDYITLTSHGLSTGSKLAYTKVTGTATMGLTIGAVYYARAVDSNTISLHTTLAGAIANTGKINLTASGTETHYLYDARFVASTTAASNVVSAAFYKISNGSEAATFTFGSNSNVNETYTGCMLSIRDAHQTTPVPVFNGTTGNYTATSDQTIPPLITTTDNCLGLVFMSLGGAVRGLLCEGINNLLLNKVGSADSLSVGWFFQAQAGAITESPVAVTGNAGNSISMVFQISPPDTGATVIPVYTVGDNSELITPLDGAVAYKTAAAPAATADTNFSTTIGDLTAADVAASNVSNAGVMPDYSSPSLGTAGSPVAGTMYGYEVILSAAKDITGKKLFINAYPSSAYTAYLAAKMADGGFAMGIRSGTGTDYKVWAMAGVDTPNITFDKYIPFVVDVDESNTLGTAGTLNKEAIISFGFWDSTTASSNTGILWQITALWFLGDTTVCGGNSAEPISVSKIVQATSTNKFRRTAFLSGASQGVFYQPIIIGNGGTNGVYLDLDATSIEFPEKFNAAKAKGNFIVPDNWVGLKYYAGASDTIKHRNSVISSPSRYHWGLHSSSSASATYDFTRLSVVGAGTITLNKAITIDRLILKDYSTLNVTDATLTNCTIADVPATNDSVTLDADTTFTSCTIDVSKVTAGNRWLSTATPNKFSGCTFTGGGGHAIRITTPGTYTFTGNTASGFGANGSDGAFFFNDSGGAVTINVASSSYTPTYKNGSGASTTVNSGASLTLTGLVTGSDIVILQDGTTTELVNVDSNAGTTYTFNYTTAEDVDICVYKAGYEPFTIRGYTLSGTDASLPISQRADRNYSNPA